MSKCRKCRILKRITQDEDEDEDAGELNVRRKMRDDERLVVQVRVLGPKMEIDLEDCELSQLYLSCE
jgi:hypothetical protein